MKLLTDATHKGIARRFAELNAHKNFCPDDIEAGREYVKAYVEFVHYVEGIHQALEGVASGHFPEPVRGEALKSHY